MVELYFVGKYQPPSIPAKEAVAKDPEKKGTTKSTKSTKKSFFFSFVLFVLFVVQGFYAFCDRFQDRNLP